MEKIFIKTPAEIMIMHEAGQILARTQIHLRRYCNAGTSLRELNQLAHEFILQNKAEHAFLNYHNFPATICTSVNNVLIHGIPDDYILKTGDLLSVDLGVKWKNYYADGAFSLIIGEPPFNKNHQCLLTAAYEALAAGIREAYPGNYLSDISKAIEAVIKKYGFFTPLEYSGHGIGKALHEPPYVLNYYDPQAYDYELKPGMVIAIEPMVIQKTAAVIVGENNWNICSADGSFCAHCEHTVAITETGCKILTIL